MAKRPWDADVAIDSDLARALIAEQHPALAPVRLTTLGQGWDNAAFLVNDTWVFRFPRRVIAVPFMESEIAVLPHLAPLLPLPVPVPRWVGEPSDAYPYPFAGYRRLPGTPADIAAPDAAVRATWATPLGRLLATIHGLSSDHPAARAAGTDRMAKGDPGRRLPVMEQRLAELGEVDDPVGVLALAERLAAGGPFAGEPALVHGDLYARHLLVGGDGALAAVLDWGDVHRGDPAIDLSIAWSLLPRAAHPAFRDAYGPVDPATWDRARFRALFYGVSLLHYGRDIGDDGFASAGLLALRQATTARG